MDLRQILVLGLLAVTGVLTFIVLGPGNAPEPTIVSQAEPENIITVPPVIISDAFPFASKYVDVLGSRMHYIDEGSGDPILFLHGNPTSMYLWRNVMPFLIGKGRVIAVDNIGFGQSDKPDIGYTYADHIRYIEGFIEALNLRNITLVIHDWGSALGLDYASRNAENVKGVAFMEAMVPPFVPVPSYEAMPPPMAEFFQTVRDPELGPELIIKQNFFIEGALPGSVIRRLSQATMDNYRAPFLDEATRKPILVWPNQIPIVGEPADVVQVVEAYSQWMLDTDMPFLHIYVSPGALNPPPVAEWLAENLNNIETIYVGQGIHFIQEDQPEAIGRAVADWYRRLNN